MMLANIDDKICINELELEFIYPQNLDKNTTNTEDFIEVIKKINKLPFNKGNHYYSDNYWDFSEYASLNIIKKALKFNFENCCYTFRDELKNYVLIKILNSTNKIQTINKKFITLYNFFNFIESKGFYYIQDIDNINIELFIKEQENKSIRTLLWTKTTLKDFFSYYSANFKDVLTQDRLNLFENKNMKAINAYFENKKLPDIPLDYYNKFLSSIIKISNNPKETIGNRGIASLYVILSQTGLRIGECLGLEADSLSNITIFNGDRAYYLNYKTWKREKGNNTYSIHKTYVNELTKQAYDVLMEIYGSYRKSSGHNYLFMGTDEHLKENKCPIDANKFRNSQFEFYAYLNNYFPIIDIDDSSYQGIPRYDIKRYSTLKKMYPQAHTIAIPVNHQFRVHVCTELYNKGVPLKYIQKFMSHLSSEMASYYVRPTKTNPQENMDFALDTLKKLVTGETKPLGGDSSLVEKIHEFIKENNFKVETDLDVICEKLAHKIPIRQKTGGVCIKSSMLRECSNDARTNEFYCAYDVCPNIFHFFYMADVSYRQSKELVESIKINKQNGFLRQVQKEANMLNTIINKKLLPEIDELKMKINEKGHNAILMEYPDLEYIILNLDDILGEVNIWKELI